MAHHSRLGELGAVTRALIETVARRVDAAPEYVAERSVGPADFLPAWFLRVGFERARAVARLEVLAGPKPYFGTGFLVAPGILMTNHHVLPDPSVARGARVLFEYEEDEQGRQLRPQLFELAPERLFVTNQILDFCLVAVADAPGHTYGVIPLRHVVSGVEAKARVNLIQHPSGGRKQIVVHGNHITEVSEAAIHYLADTEGGSSGSPVFNCRWQLIALHHLGGARDNVGVRIDVILKYLSVEAARHGAAPALRELVASVVDTGDFGLFSTAGLRVPDWVPATASGPETTPPPERELLDWMGGVEFIDAGHWDLAPLSGAASDERLAAIVAAVVEAGADFLVVEGVPEPDRSALQDRLAHAGLASVALGQRSLLCLDPAVSATPEPFTDASAELAATTCAGRRVVPETCTRLRLSVTRRPGQPARALYLIHVEIDPGSDLPSRAHRNELARTLGELAQASARDVFVVGLLADVLDRPGLVELVAPPELTIVAAPERAGDLDVGAIAWIGDAEGEQLQQVLCWPELRTPELSPGVRRVAVDRRLDLAPALEAAGPPLLMRTRFAALATNPPAPAPESGPASEDSELPAAPSPDGATHELRIDAYVESIRVRDC